MDVVSSAFANQELRGQDDQLCWALAIIGLFAVRLIVLPGLPGLPPNLAYYMYARWQLGTLLFVNLG